MFFLLVLILPVVFILGLALVLLHVRRERWLSQYAALAAKASEQGGAAVEEALRPMRELMLTESLRRGILCGVLGAAILAMAFVARFSGEPFPGPLLLVVGLLVLAAGVASLIAWFVVDRPRMPRR